MRRHRGSRGGKEPGHDLARPRRRGIEARSRTESGQAVRAADPLRGRQAAAEPVADHGLYRFGFGIGKADFPPGLPGAALADGDRPVIEQVSPTIT